MNPNLERGILLFQQSRHELAETELRQALASEPHDSYAHGLLAMCLAERKQFKEATEEAQQAVHLAPDFPFAHYAMAHVYYDRNRHNEALAAIEEAIRLDSSEADYFALLAAIRLETHQWQKALEAAELGLQMDSEHVGCTNLRAMAMVKLGRKAEAGATIDAALARNPDNAVTHANQGWTLLERGDSKKALEHFRESLRLDPGNEWARRGIVEALKARNIIYAGMLKYFLWMSKFSPRAQWAIILGGVFGNRALSALASANEGLAPYVFPLRIIYIAFVLLTWTADPLFNLMLRMNRFGRYALSREQTVASNWVGSCILLGLLSLAGALAFGFNTPWVIAAMVFGFLVLPVAGTFKCARGWPRMVMAVYSGALALAGSAAITLFFIANSQQEKQGQPVMNVADVFLILFLIGVVISTWVTNILIHQRPKY